MNKHIPDVLLKYSSQMFYQNVPPLLYKQWTRPPDKTGRVPVRTGFTHRCGVTLCMKKHECLGGKIFGGLKLQKLQLFQLFVIKILNNPKNVGTN